MSSSSNIHLYTTRTPNGVKVSIALEELGLPYEVTAIDMSKNTQKEPWFLEINPNGRIPAITDSFSDGKTIRVFESGSILEYLVDRYDTDHKISYPRGSREHVEMISWLYFQNAGVGPMQGQANHFYRYAPEQIPYGVNRYQNETRRLYSVLEKHLHDNQSDYLVGNKCTIADISHIGWVAASSWAGVALDDYPTLKSWHDRMFSRPAVDKGADVPTPRPRKPATAEEEKKKAEEARAWIQQGMKEDAEKQKSRV